MLFCTWTLIIYILENQYRYCVSITCEQNNISNDKHISEISIYLNGRFRIHPFKIHPFNIEIVNLECFPKLLIYIKPFSILRFNTHKLTLVNESNKTRVKSTELLKIKSKIT